MDLQNDPKIRKPVPCNITARLVRQSLFAMMIHKGPCLIFTLPQEIIVEVAATLPVKSRVCLLLTCRHFLRVMSGVIYRRINVSGPSARALSLTLITSFVERPRYAEVIHTLVFSGSTVADNYLTYPILTDALLLMTGLHCFTLTIAPTHTTYLLSLLKRKGIVRAFRSAKSGASMLTSRSASDSRNALPYLRELRINGDIKLVALANNRSLTSIEIENKMNKKEMAYVIDCITNTDKKVVMEKISFSIVVTNTLEFLFVLSGLSSSCPIISELFIETGPLNAMEITAALSSNETLFPKLRTLSVNAKKPTAAQFRTSRDEILELQQKQIEQCSTTRPFLKRVSLGQLEWNRHDREQETFHLTVRECEAITGDRVARSNISDKIYYSDITTAPH